MTQRLLLPGDILRLRIKNHFATPSSKLAFLLVKNNDVLRMRGGNFFVRNINLGKEICFHHDRFF